MLLAFFSLFSTMDRYNAATNKYTSSKKKKRRRDSRNGGGGSDNDDCEQILNTVDYYIRYNDIHKRHK